MLSFAKLLVVSEQTKFVLINVLQRVVVMGSVGTMSATHNVVVMGSSDTPNSHLWHKDRLKA